MSDPAQDFEDALAGVARLERAAQAELVARLVTTLVVADAEPVREAALRLKPAERAELAHQLLLSLAALPEEQLAATWDVESRRRENQAG